MFGNSRTPNHRPPRRRPTGRPTGHAASTATTATPERDPRHGAAAAAVRAEPHGQHRQRRRGAPRRWSGSSARCWPRRTCRSAGPSAPSSSSRSWPAILGFGPLEPFLQDDSVTEILVNGPDQVYVERNGMLEETDVRFRDAEEVMRIIDRIVAPLGRRVDESSPMVDARLPDGSRVNVIIPPLSLVGPCISIRKFARAALLASTTWSRLDTPDQGDGRLPARLRAGAAEHRRLRRHLHRQDHPAEHPVQLPARTTSASSPSRTRPSCSSSRSTSCGWRPARPTSRARGR